jgi:hypothetical protein
MFNLDTILERISENIIEAILLTRQITHDAVDKLFLFNFQFLGVDDLFSMVVDDGLRNEVFGAVD